MSPNRRSYIPARRRQANFNLSKLSIIMRKSLSILALLLLASVAVGCANTAKMTVHKPADLNVTGIQKLVVLDFEGPENTGKVARTVLSAQLSENQHYTLVDQSELDRVVQVSHADGAPDLKTALQAARSMGVDAVVTGKVVASGGSTEPTTEATIELVNAESEDLTSTAMRAFGFGGSPAKPRPGDDSVTLSMQIVDVHTGEVRATHEATHTTQGKRASEDGQPLNREQILAQLLQECARDAVVKLAPQSDTVSVKLASKWVWEGGNKEIAEGNRLAAEGQWAEAATHYEAALQANPEDHAAMYNLALTYEARGDYIQADLFLSDAIGRSKQTLYQEAYKRLDAAKQREFQMIAQRNFGRRSRNEAREAQAEHAAARRNGPPAQVARKPNAPSANAPKQPSQHSNPAPAPGYMPPPTYQHSTIDGPVDPPEDHQAHAISG